MPIYEYLCTACQHRFAVLQRLNEGNEHLRCEKCGAPRPSKQFSTFSAGSGKATSSASPLTSGGTGGRGFP